MTEGDVTQPEVATRVAAERPSLNPALDALEEGPLAAAPRVLGARLAHHTEEGTVAIRLTEVEAYLGAIDPGSHAYRGKTARNAVMFGPAGYLYVYFTYGMHYCANMVCGVPGQASGLLLRAGEVVEGHELAHRRRPAARKPRELAQGPARLAQALGLGKGDNGIPLFTPRLSLTLPDPSLPVSRVASGPRVGVSGEGGSEEYPWRFWIRDDPTVSKYRPAAPPGSRRRG